MLNSLIFGMKQTCIIQKTEQDVKLNFISGSSAFSVAQSVSGEISGATGLIKTVYISSGAWGSGDAAGYIIISFCEGTFQAGETITDDGSTPGEAEASSSIKAVDSYGVPLTSSNETESICSFDDLSTSSSSGIVDYIGGKFVVRDGNLFVPASVQVEEGDCIRGSSEGFTGLYKALKIGHAENLFNSNIDHFEIALQKISKKGE